MFAKGLFTNLLLIAISVGIFITYLRPTFAEIETDQDSVALYEQELTKVQSVNARLNQLASEADQLATDDRQRMYTYLPNEIDTIAVQRDLYLMAETVGVTLVGLAAVTEGGDGYQAEAPAAEMAEGTPLERSLLVPHTFEIEFSASYDLLKSFLSALEQNHYPLHVSALNITSSPSGSEDEEAALAAGELRITMSLTTYALSMQESAY